MVVLVCWSHLLSVNCRVRVSAVDALFAEIQPRRLLPGPRELRSIHTADVVLRRRGGSARSSVLNA